MIVVIADDFTGAAELAGIGLEHGLSVDIAIEQVDSSPETEMLVLATDTRSKGSGEAVDELRALSTYLKSIPYSFLYKKVDSVMRGHILEEILAITETLGIKGALLVPANPQLGRVIIEGHYYVNGKPLQETSFSSDPDFNINTSSVRELIDRNGTDPSLLITRPEDFTGDGKIVIGEASRSNDLDLWAEMLDERWLPVGAAGFFQSLLKKKGMMEVKKKDEIVLADLEGLLYICGSSFQGSRDQVKLASRRGPHVCYMPEGLFLKEANWERALGEWIEEVASAIGIHGKTIVAVSQEVSFSSRRASWIRMLFSMLAEALVARDQVRELIIEGGSTASAVLHKLGCLRLRPIQQVSQGVILMRMEDRPGLRLTMKPGSYPWPDSVWNFK
ncbi:MAG: four-carbon acid sugar kinase family protein [Bacteroidales bacterium]|nr:four-carbon acid sugar kinase family protein [Bacteroidales bacterium]